MIAFVIMSNVGELRARGWRTVPAQPGVYWWYFPRNALERFRVNELCGSKLNLRASPTGTVCLYHGMAKNLAERIEWHAAQKLSVSSLSSGFLSTFRLTLLALNDFDYTRGSSEIDAFMDALELEWRVFPSEADALAAETSELAGAFHYPLNIQNNRRPELAVFTQHLQAARKAYRERHARGVAAPTGMPPAAPTGPSPTKAFEHPILALISCTKSKASQARAAAELYQPSVWFSYAYQYAPLVADKILILSAKHGIVRPEQVLAPYDETLQGSSQVERETWADMVYPQLRATSEYREAKSIVWLAGEDYRNELLARVRSDGKRSLVPMQGLRQGEQVSWLKAQVEGRPTSPLARREERVIPSPAKARATTPGTAPRADDFRRVLTDLKAKARRDGHTVLEISAGELHRIVGGYPSSGAHRMPVCCSVMRQEMNRRDMIVSEPPKGAGASLRISYTLD
jgi:hypothetical protein